jgi:hypothetical protein
MIMIAPAFSFVHSTDCFSTLHYLCLIQLSVHYLLACVITAQKSAHHNCNTSLALRRRNKGGPSLWLPSSADGQLASKMARSV